MALTMLDPITALIIVDLQRGIVGLPSVHSIDDVVARSSALATAFRQFRLPVVLVNVAGGAPGRTERPRPGGPFPDGWTDLIPELDRQPDDIVVTKRTWGAFAGTNLESQLRQRGVTQVVIAGVATGTGVESTARQAYEAGFNVTLATDAMTDPRSETHDYSIANVFPRLGERLDAGDHRSVGNTEQASMNWLHLVSYFFGGAFLANAIPHLVSGQRGEPFQSPFATPRGEGLSSSTVNVLWGFFNLVVGYLLVCRVGEFALLDAGDVVALGLGALLLSLFCARHFGRFHGGNTPAGS